MVGESAIMRQVKDRIVKVARSMAPVLVRGESGTGKELAACALHANSHRADGPIVAVNCGAIPETLLEAEFFGVKKGAYTGANQDRDGLFQAARGGTLMLDEIGDLPQSLQAKLLRFLQERVIERLGGRQEIPVDVRICCATHQNLKRLIGEGRFREDLYYRLAEIVIDLPPLRERIGDAALLAHVLARKFGQQQGGASTLSSEAVRAIEAHHWPGNIRELENCLKRASIMADGKQITLRTMDELLKARDAIRAEMASAARPRSYPRHQLADFSD